MGLYNDILEHLEARGLCFVRKFVPYFLASFGDHIFNIRNNQFNDVNEPLAIYWENQRIPDMRLFILFIAPPGFSKSTFLQHLLRDFYGVLADCGIETYFKAYMTEAALVGSFGGDEKKAESLPLKGFLENHRNCIVGIEEFSSLLAASKQEHSKGLDSALLDWATHGEITKDLRRGEISFKTNATLWAGTQLGKERIELRGGMARRFFFIYWIPNELDEKELVEATISSHRCQRLDTVVLGKLRSRVKNLYEKLEDLEGVFFTEDLENYFRENLNHNEIPLFRRLAIGYAIMQEDFDKDLSVGIDDELRRLMDTAVEWRRRIYREINDVTGLGTDIVIQAFGSEKTMLYEDLAKKLLLYEVSYAETDEYLRKLMEKPARIRMYGNDEKKMVVELIG